MKTRIRHLKPIDPYSEYFRICPNDGVEFMADDLREKYCSDKCHDEYHNRIKRFRRASEPLKDTVVPFEKTPDERKMVDLKRNIQILLAYGIGRDGIWVNIEDLLAKGFKLYAHTARFPSMKSDMGYLMEVGPFIINREMKNQVIIRNKTKSND